MILQESKPKGGPARVSIWFATTFIVGPIFIIVASALAIGAPSLINPIAALFWVGYFLLWAGILTLFIYTVHVMRTKLTGPKPTWVVLDAVSYGLITLGTTLLVIGASFLIATATYTAFIFFTIATGIILTGVAVKLVADQQQISVLYLSNVWKRFSSNPTQQNIDAWETAFKKEWYNLGGTNFYFFGAITFLLGSAALLGNSNGFTILGLAFYIVASVLVIHGSAFKLRYSILGERIPAYKPTAPAATTGV